MKDQQNLLESLQKLSAQEIISLFGGIRPMANKLEVAVSTVQGWKERNKIPNARYKQILHVAIENGLMSNNSNPSYSAEAADDSQREANETFDEEPLLMKTPQLDIPIAHKTIVKQSIFSRALLSVLTIGCLILAGSTIYLYDKMSYNQTLLELSNVKNNAEALLETQYKLSELQNDQQAFAREFLVFAEAHKASKSQTLTQEQFDAVANQVELTAKKLDNFQAALLAAQSKFSEKTNDLSELESRLNQFTTKNTSLPLDQKGLQSKYVTLWLVQTNLEEKVIQGGQFQEEYQILKGLNPPRPRGNLSYG